MEYTELIEKINISLVKMAKKLRRDGFPFEENDLLQELYLHLWDEWKNGKLSDRSISYILRGCYLYLKNFMRKAQGINRISVEQFLENGNDLSVYEKIYDMDRIFTLLNKKEIEILKLLAAGYTIREVGEIFGISHVMVIKIIKNVRRKTERYRETVLGYQKP